MQTLPERDGDPEPPPDNGQHIALGCFTEYLRFLERIGEGGSYLRTRLGLPVIDEDGSVGDDPTVLTGAAALRRICRCETGCGSRLHTPATARRAVAAEETFGELLRRLGRSDAAVDAFLGRLHPAGAQPAGRRGRRRRGPLHRAHGAARAAREQRPRPADAAARRDARRRGGTRARRPRPARLAGRVARRPRRRRDRRRRAAGRERAPARRAGARSSRTRRSSASISGSTAKLLAAAARGAARLGRALGLRPRRADRPRAGARPVPHRRLERRAGAARGARPRPRRTRSPAS